MSKEITWSRMNLKEVISELPYPLTQSVFEISNKSFFLEQYKKQMAYKLLPEDTEFTKVFYGRLYFNINTQIKMVSDFGSDPEMLKMSFGGFQPVLIENPDKLSIIDRTKMMFTFIKTFYNIININKITDYSFKMRSDRYRTDFDKNLKSLTDKEAIEYFDSLDELTKNDLTLIIGGGMNFNYWELRKMLISFVDIEKPDDIINQLVTGTNNIISANQTLELMRLAGYAKDNGLELERNYDEISDPIFKSMLNEFLHKFGHRGLYETCIESPRYYENPEAILKIIKSYVTEGMVSPQDVVSCQKKIREDAIENILKRKDLSYYKKKRFKQFLDNYTNFIRLREENRYHLVMGVTLSRRHVLEMGRRFTERGVLEEQQDIFFLTLPEIKKLLSGEKIDCKKVVDERKSERERNSRYIHGCSVKIRNAKKVLLFVLFFNVLKGKSLCCVLGSSQS